MVAGKRGPGGRVTRAEAIKALEAYKNLRPQFQVHARARMNKVLKELDYLEQLSVRDRYHYTDREWQLMYDTLRRKLEEMDKKFRDGKGFRPRFEFEFPEEGT